MGRAIAVAPILRGKHAPRPIWLAYLGVVLACAAGASEQPWHGPRGDNVAEQSRRAVEARAEYRAAEDVRIALESLCGWQSDRGAGLRAVGPDRGQEGHAQPQRSPPSGVSDRGLVPVDGATALLGRLWSPAAPNRGSVHWQKSPWWPWKATGMDPASKRYRRFCKTNPIVSRPGAGEEHAFREVQSRAVTRIMV